MAAKTGTPIYADTRGLAKLARDLRAASPAAWKACRVGLTAAGEKVAMDARRNASFSKRIPGSVHVKVGAGANVKVIAGGDPAPDAAPIENKGKGFVRHPTFSPRPTVDEKVGWTSKNSKPAFLAPAFDANRAAALAMVEKAVGDAVERVIIEGKGK